MKTIVYVLYATIALVLPKKGRVIALMYHSVGNNAHRLTVRSEEFRRQMMFLKSHCAVVSMADFLLWREGKKDIPKNAVLVTIDDGYKDTFTEAFPILRELGIPFTLFLTTDLSPMEKLGNLPRPTWDDICAMHQSGLMEVGLHGHEHKKISSVITDPQARDRELKGSIEMIERFLGARPRVYAYAFGARHDAVGAYLQPLGISTLFGITDGSIAKDSLAFALRRVQIDSTMSFFLFRLRTTRAVDVAFRIRRFLLR